MKIGYARVSTDDQNPDLQHAALKAAVARGVNMGRKPLLTPQQVAHASKLLEQEEHKHDTVAKSLGVSRRTLYRYRVLQE